MSSGLGLFAIAVGAMLKLAVKATLTGDRPRHHRRYPDGDQYGRPAISL